MSPRFNGSREISLLTYLTNGAKGPPIGLSLASAKSPEPEGATPFSILHDSDPLTRVVAASFVTNSGCELKQVLLLLQKDRYTLEKDELWPVTNRDIDASWRHAFDLHGNDTTDSSAILLSGQLGDDGIPNLFSSLFYCKAKSCFFSPPCSICGNALTLCTDDDLLLLCGLHPYSTSIKRYLYCASCGAHSPDGFYVPARDMSDPDTLRGFSEMIEGFGQLSEERDCAGSFPCLRCPDHEECYGAKHAVRTRIVPFSFYPFYALIFDSLSLPAPDFLSLVAGAPIDELKRLLLARHEPGRVRCLESLQRMGLTGVSLFSSDDERCFLETLYLKLSFLGDVLTRFLARPEGSADPEMRLSIDRIWVSLPGKSGLLPSFWNFRTSNLDIVRPSDLSRLLPERISERLIHSGLVWFYSLLVNSRQGSRDVMLALKEVIRGGALPEAVAALLSHPVCSAEQIFWNPDGKRVKAQWLSIWRQTITLGAGLLRSAVNSGQEWSPVSFFEQLESCRDDVKSAMFTEAPLVEERVSPVIEIHPADDETIHRALAGIIARWRERESTVAEPVNPPRESAAREMETVMLSPTAMVSPEPSAEVEEWTETVVLSPRSVIPSPPPLATPAVPGNDALLETVVLSTSAVKTELQAGAVSERGDDMVPETVILSPGARLVDSIPTPHPPRPGAVEAESGVSPGTDDIPETVIIQPQQTRVRGKGWKD